MKDYYKILGLKEKASAEEIHERWIELMQKYHPDHGSEGTRDEDVAKQINEAYQVLKHSSSRMEYDFERLHQRSPKKFSMKKFIFSISGLIGLTFLFVFCLIVFLEPQVPPPSVPKPRPSFSKPDKPEFSTVPHYEPGPSLEAPKPVSKTEKVVRVQGEVTSQQKRQEAKPVTRLSEKKIDPPMQIVQKPGPSLEAPKPVSKTEKVLKVQEEVISHQKRQEAKPVTRLSEKKIDPPSQVIRSEGSLKIPPISSSKELKRVESIEHSKPDDTQKPPAKIPDVHPISDSAISVKTVERMTEVKPSSPIATEEEVKRFFANYIERYNRRDIHGFLSLFSSKAIHNQKDGLEGIRRIYNNFFSQSQILQYHLEDFKMKIYQNAVEAKARYQIDQTSNNEGDKKVWQGRIQWLLIKEEGGLRIASINYQNEESP